MKTRLAVYWLLVFLEICACGAAGIWPIYTHVLFRSPLLLFLAVRTGLAFMWLLAACVDYNSREIKARYSGIFVPVRVFFIVCLAGSWISAVVIATDAAPLGLRAGTYAFFVLDTLHLADYVIRMHYSPHTVFHPFVSHKAK